MRKIRRYAMAAALVAATMEFSAARAQTITWQSPQNITGDSDVVTNGALFTAWDTGTSVSGTTTVNGVPFAQNTAGTTVGNTTLSGGASYASGFYIGGLSASYGSLLGSVSLLTAGAGGYTMTLQVTGLKVGDPYVFQWWTDDSRGSFSQTRQTVAKDPNGNSVSLTQNMGGPNNLGQYAIGTFTADTSTMTVTFIGENNGVPTGGGYGVLNAFQLREVPEPSSVILLLAGGASLLVWRRQK